MKYYSLGTNVSAYKKRLESIWESVVGKWGFKEVPEYYLIFSSGMGSQAQRETYISLVVFTK